jgi:hypothetical protein
MKRHTACMLTLVRHNQLPIRGFHLRAYASCKVGLSPTQLAVLTEASLPPIHSQITIGNPQRAGTASRRPVSTDSYDVWLPFLHSG